MTRLRQHLITIFGPLNAADNAFWISRHHFARQVRKNARVNFHVPFRRECHESEMLACTYIGELGRDLARPLPQFPSVPRSGRLQWNYAISASDEKFDRNATTGNSG